LIEQNEKFVMDRQKGRRERERKKVQSTKIDQMAKNKNEPEMPKRIFCPYLASNLSYKV